MRCLTSAQTDLSVLFSISELTEAEVAPFLHPIPEVWHVIQGNFQAGASTCPFQWGISTRVHSSASEGEAEWWF